MTEEELSPEERAYYKGLKDAVAACNAVEDDLREQGFLQHACGALDARNRVLSLVMAFEEARRL